MLTNYYCIQPISVLYNKKPLARVSFETNWLIINQLKVNYNFFDWCFS